MKKKSYAHVNSKCLQGGVFDLDDLVKKLLEFKAKSVQNGATSFSVYMEHDTDPSGTESRYGLSLNAYKTL